MAGNNTNIIHVEVIENLCKSLKSRLGAIEAVTPEQFRTKHDAQDYIHLFSKKQVKALRNACEDN